MIETMVRRLINQLRSRGVKNAKSMAIALLTKRGHYRDGKLTASGRERQALGNAGRAKSRAVKANGGSVAEYSYNAATNSTRKK